jgi:serine/threonine protein kinase
MLHGYDSDTDWPPEAEEMYERIEELGRGSYGVVWMGRRKVPPKDEYDDEYVALKNIEIRAHKSYVYATREIEILRELRHPCVIRLIRAFPIWEESSQLVVMQLARGPDVQYLVTNRGALGLPLARLVARHLVAAVSYLHGRAVIHRDIKPTNCILCLCNSQGCPDIGNDWLGDDLIWSDGPDAQAAVDSNKWKLMLVDFGFARALEGSELGQDKQFARKSIVNESMCIEDVAKIVAMQLDAQEIEKVQADLRHAVEDNVAINGIKKRLSMVSVNLQELRALSLSDGSEEDEPETSPAPTTPERPTKSIAKTPESISEEVESSRSELQEIKSKQALRASFGRQSSARTKVRALSALGTKAYAAPEIKIDLRNKTESDINKNREALTECVADYGMIADSYSVGWTLRVVLSGVPPNQSVSSYMLKVEAEMKANAHSSGCCCFGSAQPTMELPKLRDTSEFPKEAALLINALTKRNVDQRMTVREAQSHPYIKGMPGEKEYELPEGDIPSKHGDPVVPLKCSLTLG